MYTAHSKHASSFNPTIKRDKVLKVTYITGKSSNVIKNYS